MAMDWTHIREDSQQDVEYQEIAKSNANEGGYSWSWFANMAEKGSFWWKVLL